MTRRRVLWAAMTVLSVIVVIAASAYFRFDPSQYFPQQRAVYLSHQVPLYLHITGAMAALATMPWQFIRRLRDARPRLHRAIGSIYLVGVLVGGVGALLLSVTAYGGLVATLGFASLATWWLVAGALGLIAIRGGDVGRHERWMRRSAALTFAAVTLRLYVGVYTALVDAGLTSVSFHTAYAAIAWLAWVPNLAIAWWLTRPRSEGRLREVATRHLETQLD